MRILFAPICFRMAICCISECGLAISSRYFESIGRCVKMRTFKKRSVRMSRNLRLSSPLPSNSWAPGTISEKLAGKECCQPMYFCSNCSSDEAISNRFSEASQPRLFPYKTSMISPNILYRVLRSRKQGLARPVSNSHRRSVKYGTIIVLILAKVSGPGTNAP